jgi:NAD(P)-dependent dehydrogenase (short-subunit alcohol dehydrogenase family)
MDIQGKVAVITGAGSGIGRACAQAFAAAGARAVVLADRDLASAQAAAQAIEAQGHTALALACDVSREADIQALVATSTERLGRVDVFFSNAGILGQPGGFELDDALWTAMWNIHCMAHVWAARAVVPTMLAQQGGGYFVSTASAAGLLTIVESAPYAVTKHAAVAFAEWLAIAYGRRGVRVSCLCPQSVDTAMVQNSPVGTGSAGLDGVISPEAVAQCVLDALRDEQFLILPHPQVAQYLQAKGANPGRWIGGMQKMHARFATEAPR